MVKETSDIPRITPSNTKKEMLEAFKTLKARLEDREKAALKPEKERTQKQTAETIQAAERVGAEDVTQRMSTLTRDLGQALAEIASKLEDEKLKYTKVKEAIELKERELKEIFEIEKSAFALAALLEAQKQKSESFEAEMARRKAILDEEIATTRADWEREKRSHVEAVKEHKGELEKTRKREAEEYQYTLKRDRELKKNQLADELQKLEREIQSRREAFERQTGEKETELGARETAVAEREKYMDELQKRVDAFPAAQETAVQQAVKGTTERLKLEAKTQVELLEKGFEGERNVLASKIESLEQLATTQKKQIDALSAQLDKAYAKVQDIAVKAVVSAQPQMPAPQPSRGASEGSG